MYEPRFYRDKFSHERFHSFIIEYKETDLWIGVDKASFRSSMIEFTHSKVVELRNQLETYIETEPLFATSFSPVDIQLNAPEIAIEMAQSARKADVGPMAAVAGAFSEFIGKALINNFECNEVVVENGGDLFMRLEKELILSIYAGNHSPFTNKIGIRIPASETPIGICTSSGTVGPSISFGKADAVMVASKNTALADAFATSIGNRVKVAADVEPEIEKLDHSPEIISLVIICDDKIGIKGQFELIVLK